MFFVARALTFVVSSHVFLRYSDASMFFICTGATVALQVLIESFVKGLFSFREILTFIALAVIYEMVACVLVQNGPLFSSILYIFSFNDCWCL